MLECKYEIFLFHHINPSCNFLFILSNLNQEIIVLDLFFLKIEGVSLGYSLFFLFLLELLFLLFFSYPSYLEEIQKFFLIEKMKILKPKQIILALDFDSIEEANSIVKLLDPKIFRLKIGKQLYAGEGPKILENLNKKGFDIFLDLKIQDIPNTVYKKMKNLLNHKVWMTNIHLLGGEEMIQAAREAKEHSNSEALLIGVSVLTSLSEKNIKNMGFSIKISELVNILSISAKKNNLDGVVCSAREVPEIKENFGEDFITVTPGIRIQEDNNDQSRVATLREAEKNGSDFIVLGREVTASEDISKMIKKVESYII